MFFFALSIIISQFIIIVNSSFSNHCSYVNSANADPIVQPGRNGSHLHDFISSTTINPFTTSESLMGVNCTTCSRMGDKSAYWFPSVFYIYPNGTEVKLNVSNGVAAAYYMFNTTALMANESLHLIPIGLKMIVGNPMALNPSDNTNFSVSIWNVEKPDNMTRPIISKQGGFPEQAGNAKTIQITVNTPSCMVGPTVLDSEDHKSHMAYVDPKTRQCPPSHPYRIPSINFHPRFTLPEYASWTSLEEVPLRLSLSQGRGQLYQWHIDVFSAWDQQQLQNLLDKCGNSSPGDCKESMTPAKDRSQCTKQVRAI